MNLQFHGGDVATLEKRIDYEENTVVKKEIASKGNTKLILMAFDEEEELSPHTAPADAILVLLKGEAEIAYEAAEHHLKTGDMIYFEEGGLHSVEAKGRKKMALLLPRK